MAYSTFSPSFKSVENGYNTSWYDECTCCPYGYHIDLDFVRYCESISKDAENRTGSFKRRKDRRRTRQSMEVLLGLTPPVLAVLDEVYKPSHHTLQESPKIVPKQAPSQTQVFHFDDHDGFDDAVSDFERTLQRSKHKLSNNLPDVTAVSENLRRIPSISSVSSASGSMTVLPNSQDGLTRTTDFDAVSVESCLSPMALQNIREALALSLERTKELEHQVRLLPRLQEELSTLKGENYQLNKKLLSAEASREKLIQEQYLQITSPNRKRSQSFTHIDFDNASSTKKEPPPIPTKKDFGVMCGVLTRNIGVGHQNPNTKHASTTTDLEFADKWLPEKARFLNSQPMPPTKISVAKGSQTLFVKEKRDVGTQSLQDRPEQKITSHTFSQTIPPDVVNVSVMAVARKHDISIQKNVDCYSVGCSDDTLSDILCEKCNIYKVSIGVGPEKAEDFHTNPVSLANLSSRSKSFNLGDDRLDFHKRTRTVASQYELLNSISRSCQSENVKTTSKSSQHEVKFAEKTVQYENTNISKTTDTKDLRTPVKHVGVEARESKPKTVESGNNTDDKMKPRTKDIASNTLPLETKKAKTIDVGSNTKPTTLELEKPCGKCATREREPIEFKEFKKSDTGSPSPSRIPVPTTPIEARKFRRQDTYTKIYSTSPPDKLEPLSGLDFSTKAISAESISPFDKVKENLKLETPSRVESSTILETPKRLEDITQEKETPSSSSRPNGVTFAPITKVQIHEVSLPVSESTIFRHNTQDRKKAVPSKEMQGAMKVLNDSILKNSHKPIKNQSAIGIVQSEWFKMMMVTANPLDVEDYLDAFEDMSSQLLEYIVNLTDASGNTAMHYAVSHGNFDVVSILLDSKVCDINKPNKAGYTCVMLVSLAEVRSKTHANVVRKLFQMADVNIRARQHGQTALMLAVSHGRLDMVKILLEAGADINIQDDDGSTALMCAAEHGHIEIVKHFLSHPDCDSSITDVDGSTALKIAMEAGHRQIGVLLYAHERHHQKSHHPLKLKKTKSNSPKTPSSPLPIRSSHRALTDTNK